MIKFDFFECDCCLCLPFDVPLGLSRHEDRQKWEAFHSDSHFAWLWMLNELCPAGDRREIYEIILFHSILGKETVSRFNQIVLPECPCMLFSSEHQFPRQIFLLVLEQHTAQWGPGQTKTFITLWLEIPSLIFPSLAFQYWLLIG